MFTEFLKITTVSLKVTSSEKLISGSVEKSKQCEGYKWSRYIGKLVKALFPWNFRTFPLK